MPGLTNFKIFVGNLGEGTKSDELRKLFEEHGEVTECDVVKNYAFVHMKTEDEGNKAIRELNGRLVNGSNIRVEASLSKRYHKDTVKIFVGNIPEGVRPMQLREMFSKFGTVVECDVLRTYGFVHMEAGKWVDEAISELNGKEINGTQLNVRLSTSQVRQRPGMGDPEQCYRCGRSGHWSRECPKNPSRSPYGPPPPPPPGPGPDRSDYGSYYRRDPYPPPPPPSYLRERMAPSSAYRDDYMDRFDRYDYDRYPPMPPPSSMSRMVRRDQLPPSMSRLRDPLPPPRDYDSDRRPSSSAYMYSRRSPPPMRDTSMGSSMSPRDSTMMRSYESDFTKDPNFDDSRRVSSRALPSRRYMPY